MTALDADDLRRYSLHEAGHCVAAWKTGRRCGPVTVARPGSRFGGSAHLGAVPPIRARDYKRLDPAAPLPVWPTAIQRRYFVLAVGAAAGQVAETLYYWPARSGRPGEPVAGLAAELAEIRVAAEHEDAVKVAPTRAEEARMVSFHADADGGSDEDDLSFWASQLYPSPEDGKLRFRWLAWVEADAERILRLNPRPVMMLAAALQTHGSLSGKAVRGLLEAAGQ